MIRTDYPELDETVYRETLPCGLETIVVPRKGFTRHLAYFVTDYGSIHTDFTLDGETFRAPDGVAHFLEHKMFDLPGRDVSGEFAAMGASVNAFTSYDMTAYYFTATENFSDCLKLLLEFVSTPYFTKESVDKEQGIIGQEIGMNDDSPDTRVFENLMEIMYREHPVRVPILGTAQTIGTITPEILYRCHRAFYTPGNMILCVVGDVEPEEVASIANTVLGMERKSVGSKNRLWREEMTCPDGLIRASMEVAMPSFQLGFKCEPTGSGEEAIRREVVGDLAAEALFGESSALYLRLYEQGWIDSSFGGGFETLDGCALLTCGGDSDCPEAVRDAILEEARRLGDAGVEEAAFARMKRSALGRRMKDLDGFDSTCFRLCAYAMSDFDYFRFPEIYREVTGEEVRQFLRTVVTEDRAALSVVEP